MDIISHGLWANALCRFLKFKFEQIKVWQGVIWGFLPDIFSFTVAFMSLIVLKIFGVANSPQTIFSHDNANPIYNLTIQLYKMSHSLIVFTIIFVLAWIIFKKPILVMLGWLLHIVIDIPSHGISEWATPIFWPISNLAINGYSWWRNPWVIFVNYLLLGLAYLTIYILSKKIAQGKYKPKGIKKHKTL